MYERITEEFIDFVTENPTCFHVVQSISEGLKKEGFGALPETEIWDIKPGGCYYTTRNGSSLVAFKVPENDVTGFNIMAAHTDSPALKIKGTRAEIPENAYVKLNVECYGGLLMSTWFDRPLSLAGRVMVREAAGQSGVNAASSGSTSKAIGKTAAKAASRSTSKAALPSYRLVEKLVKIDRDLLVIPSVAIHMNREANKGFEYNPQVDLLPLFGMNVAQEAANVTENSKAKDVAPKASKTQKPSNDKNASESQLLRVLSEELGVDPKDIVDFDLFVYDRTPGRIWGANNEFFSVQHIDDLQCAYSAYRGFIDADTIGSVTADKAKGTKNKIHASMPVLALFDNEEVGSGTKQGANSTFLEDVLSRISEALGYGRQKQNAILAGSFMVSADNAHALHPNHPEHHDPVNRPIMNKGIVIKHAANQHYTTDAVSATLFKEICNLADVPTQEFYNRSDKPGGSTLGNISNSHVSVNSVDIGLPQLAMHSCYETAGVLDGAYMARASKLFFSKTLVVDSKTNSYYFK